MGWFLALTAPLSAATFNFVEGPTTAGASVSMTSDGIGLVLTGHGDDIVIGDGAGLGVAGVGDSAFTGSMIESWGSGGEAVLLSFDRAVRLQSLSFTFADHDDRVALTGGGIDSIFKIEHDPSTGAGTISFGTNDWVGTDFTLGPQSWTLCTWFFGQNMCETRHSGFRIASVEVSEAPAVVPLPLSAVALASGLAGLVLIVMRRRRDT